MRSSIVLVLATATVSPAWAQTPEVTAAEAAAAAITAEEDKLEAFVDGVVQAHRRLRGIPAVSVSVVKDGKLLFAKGYGVADIDSGRKADGDRTLFRIGSVSKTFVWTAVMMLVDRGKLDLSEDVQKYLKKVAIPEAFDTPVTLNHIMAHRAGFEDTLALFTHRDDETTTLAEALIADQPERAMAPGTRTSYSNWSSALAAQIVENVSGMSYEAFLDKEILKPLGMSRTALRGPSQMAKGLRADLATGYILQGGPPKKVDYMQIGPYAPAGAMSSTAEDMAKWMRLHLARGQVDGVRLMSRKAHGQMWTRAFDDRPAAADMAHGFMTKTYGERTTFGHGGATGSFFTMMQLVPDMGLGVYVCQNAAPDRELVMELPDLVIDYLQKREPVMVPEPQDGKSADYSELAGTYLSNRRSFTRFEKVFMAGSAVSVALSDKGGLLLIGSGKVRRIHPLVGMKDTFEDDFGHRVFFGRDTTGAVTYVSALSGTNTYERVKALQQPVVLGLAVGATALFCLTTLLGAWCRLGRPRTTTALGTLLNGFDTLAALCGVLLVVLAIVVAVSMQSFVVSGLVDYPPASLVAARWVAVVLFGFGVGAVISILPGWVATGWSLSRKVHHTLFAISLGALAYLLMEWKVVFTSFA